MDMPTIGRHYRIKKEKIIIFSMSKEFWEENYSFQGLIDGERIKLPIAGVFKSATRKEKDDWEQLKLA